MSAAWIVTVFLLICLLVVGVQSGAVLAKIQHELGAVSEWVACEKLRVEGERRAAELAARMALLPSDAVWIGCLVWRPHEFGPLCPHCWADGYAEHLFENCEFTGTEPDAHLRCHSKHRHEVTCHRASYKRTRDAVMSGLDTLRGAAVPAGGGMGVGQC